MRNLVRRAWAIIVCLALTMSVAGCSTTAVPMTAAQADRWLAESFTGEFTLVSQEDDTSDPAHPARTFDYTDQDGLEFHVTSYVYTNTFLGSTNYVGNTTDYLSVWYGTNIDFEPYLAENGLDSADVEWTWSSVSAPCLYTSLAPLSRAVAETQNSVRGPIKDSVAASTPSSISPFVSISCAQEGNSDSLGWFAYPSYPDTADSLAIETALEKTYVSDVRMGRINEQLPDEVLQAHRPDVIELTVGDQSICDFSWQDREGKYENRCSLTVTAQRAEDEGPTPGQDIFANLITALGGEYVSDGFEGSVYDHSYHAEGRAHWTIGDHTWSAVQVTPPPPGVTSQWSLTVTEDGADIDVAESRPTEPLSYSLSDIEKLTGTTISVDYITSRAIVEA